MSALPLELSLSLVGHADIRVWLLGGVKVKGKVPVLN
jgi:hypothetical protein